MTTDPGQVPVYWGFVYGDSENKRRRYCLMCNVFKPERCHHCSACNRCVLNMDHHCPWINNCVGFWNRKYFILLLIYVLLTTYFTLISLSYDVYLIIKWEIETFVYEEHSYTKEKIIRACLLQASFILTLIVAGLMTLFLKFHLWLVGTNKTTIENLDKKSQPYKSMYDLGKDYNWAQVFGTNTFLYPFPIFGSSGKPQGDGIEWITDQPQDDDIGQSSQHAISQQDSRSQFDKGASFQANPGSSSQNFGQGTFGGVPGATGTLNSQISPKFQERAMQIQSKPLQQTVYQNKGPPNNNVRVYPQDKNQWKNQINHALQNQTMANQRRAEELKRQFDGRQLNMVKSQSPKMNRDTRIKDQVKLKRMASPPGVNMNSSSKAEFDRMIKNRLQQQNQSVSSTTTGQVRRSTQMTGAKSRTTTAQQKRSPPQSHHQKKAGEEVKVNQRRKMRNL